MNVVVLVPVLDRPGRALPLAESLRASCGARLLFLVQKYDRDERRACEQAARAVTGVEVEVVRFAHQPGDYARKINHGVRVTSEDWIFQGADDLRFHDGWLDAAMLAAASTGARVVGTNDLCNPRVRAGKHSTHSLVHRSYVEQVGTVDEPGLMLHEGYFHNFCDDELVTVARMRREFVHARAAVVEHLHPNGGTVAMDKTYERALDPQRFDADRRIFHKRRAVLTRSRARAAR